MKQTAVEWLLDEIDDIIPDGLRDRLEFIGLKAKEMEKQQIVEAHGIRTKSINQDESEIQTGRQYYNETFNK